VQQLDAFAGHVLILSGSPGSGKTTIAEAIARLPGAVPKVHLHTDDFWGNIKHGLIAPWLPESDAQNRMIMEIAAGVAGRYAGAGYLVALDGVVRPAMLDAYRALPARLHYIVLRTSVEEAVARCTARGGDSLTDPTVVASLHAEFANLGECEGHVLAVDGLDRQQTQDAVIAALQSGAYRLRTVP
jgi:chloramphenicol 3-O-phosphotransferase